MVFASICLPDLFLENYKYPTNARVVIGVGIFPINSGKCVVKKSSELDLKVSVPRAMPVVSVASKYEPKNRW